MLKVGIPVGFLTKQGSIDRSIGGGGKRGRAVNLGGPVNTCTHINGTSRQSTSTIKVLTLCSPGE